MIISIVLLVICLLVEVLRLSRMKQQEKNYRKELDTKFYD